MHSVWLIAKEEKVSKRLHMRSRKHMSANILAAGEARVAELATSAIEICLSGSIHVASAGSVFAGAANLEGSRTELEEHARPWKKR